MEVLKRIKQAGLTMKASKCAFANAEVEYLGHTIGLGKVVPHNAKGSWGMFFFKL